MVDPVPNYSELLRGARERLNSLTDEVLNAGRANREMLETMIMGEVDRAAARLGFARADEVDRLRVELAELRVDLRDLSGDVTRLRTEGRPDPVTPDPVAPAPAKKAPAKKAAAKKAPAKKAPAKKTAAKKTAAKQVAGDASDPA